MLMRHILSMTDTINQSAKEELCNEIQDAIAQVVEVKEVAKIKSLSVYDPEKVAKILYLYSKGTSQTALVKKYKYSRCTVLNIARLL